jgi:hypothetical protein
MNTTQARFYLDAIRVFTEKNMPLYYMINWYNMIFIELSQVVANELSLEHTQLMESAELFYAGQLDFKRAGLLKSTRETAFKVFEARDLHLKQLKELLNKKRNNDDSKAS